MRRRTVMRGTIFGVAGIVLVLAGMSKASIGLVSIGALAILIATGLLSPLLAGPLSSALGRPLVGALGVPGRLGRENSTRNPRRTSQTAAALMVGLSLVATIAVLGRRSARRPRTVSIAPSARTTSSPARADPASPWFPPCPGSPA